MLKSDSIDKLVQSLCKFQAEVEPIKKDANNPFFKSKYADLPGCIEATKKTLAANGLAVAQPTRIEGGVTILVTILSHTSGQFIIGEYLLSPVKSDPQSMGSAMTYARRYSYLSILGLAAEDDDGAAASGTVKTDDRLTQQLKATSHKPAPVQAPRPQALSVSEDIPPPGDEYGSEDDPGEYVIKNKGFNLGKKIKALSKPSLEKEIAFWGKFSTPDAVEFCSKANAQLSRM